MHRLVNKADFERLLSQRATSRSTHFALHHVIGAPQLPASRPDVTVIRELSTAVFPLCPQPVDDLRGEGLWFGCIVPKRHARRAVTRSLLKRQLRLAFHRHVPRMPAGMWLLRLRAPFPAAEFVSAASQALALAARSELDGLLAQSGTGPR